MSSLFSRLKFTLGTKLIALISVLLLGSLISLSGLSTRLYVSDSTALIQQMNAEAAGALANQIRSHISAITDAMRMAGTALRKGDPGTGARREILDEVFRGDLGLKRTILVSISKQKGRIVLDAKADGSLNRYAQGELLKDGVLTFAEEDRVVARVMRGEPVFEYRKGLRSSLLIALPFVKDSSEETFKDFIVGEIDATKLNPLFSENEITNTYLTDAAGKLLAHSDPTREPSEDLSHHPAVRTLLQSSSISGLSRYEDPVTADARLGAYRKVGFGGLGVVVEVPESKALQAASRVQHRSLALAIAILGIAFAVGYFFSRSVSWPVTLLARAARRVAEGDFRISLPVRGRDEISDLTRTFNHMAVGLQERDRVKATFSKFHSKEIAEMLLSGDVKLGGERRTATVFFSDVRGFTGMSETMEPESVVEMLNEYMTVMVDVIQKHGGVVDKYVGDAIMALWGIPLSRETDEENAVRACLEMRRELCLLNERRLARGQHAIKIGMGLNSGVLIAGNIGSNHKMEYTVIGDAVNVASRIESMTKHHGTDLLIAGEVAKRVSHRFVLQACESTRVKGKSQALDVFKVLGTVDESGLETLIETPYSSFSSDTDDKVAI